MTWETWVQSLGWEETLEKEMATHSSILAWRIPMDRGAWQATVHGVTGLDMTEQLNTQCKKLMSSCWIGRMEQEKRDNYLNHREHI